MADKTHVVVTVYTARTGTVIIHTYGPYTVVKARAERRKILKDYWWETPERLQVHACKMLNTDMMNEMKRLH